MTNYICPKCNTEMYYDEKNVWYVCTNEASECKLLYCDYKPNDIWNYTLSTSGLIIVKGTFEYCCRVFKLKAFS